MLILLASLLPFLLIRTYADPGTNQDTNSDLKPQMEEILRINVNDAEKAQTVDIPVDKALFKLSFQFESDGKTLKATNVAFKPELIDFYKKVGYLTKSQNVVVVYPIFTQAAYGPRGFYDYYKGKCDLSCLTIPIPDQVEPYYSASEGSTIVLSMLNYSFISDIDIDRDPAILKKYDKVILLHNEYVTRKEYHAIVLHPNVVYLYPNALYAQVNVDYNKDTITLVKGHGYPSQDIKNGFHWKFDNSRFEFDVNCKSWKFYDIRNGKMLNCYPDYKVFTDANLLDEIRN